MAERKKGKSPAEGKGEDNIVDFNNIIKKSTNRKKREKKDGKGVDGITSETSKKNNASANRDASKTKVNNANDQTLAAILGEGKKKDIKITQKTVTVKHKRTRKGRKPAAKKIVKKVVIKKRRPRKHQEENEELPPIIIKKHKKRARKQPKKKIVKTIVVKKKTRSSRKEKIEEEPAPVIKRVKKHRKATTPKKRTIVNVIINRINPSNGKLEQVTETISREEAERRMQSEDLKIIEESSQKSSSSRSSKRSSSSEASSSASQEVIKIRKRKHHRSNQKKVVSYITIIKKRINPITGREEEYEDRVAVQEDSDDISESEVCRPLQYDGATIKVTSEDLKAAPPQTADPHAEDLVLQIATEAAAEADEAGCSLAELLERKPYPPEIKAAVLDFHSQRVSELKEMTRPPPLKRYTRSFGIRAEM